VKEIDEGEAQPRGAAGDGYARSGEQRGRHTL
jgi:hypothetical protein